MTRPLCTRCGDSIHPDTAARNAGLCIPCVRGNQLTIQQRTVKRNQEREAERAWRESPAWTYWTSLTDRVYKQPDGFDVLSRGDQLYYLVNVLSEEVHNGGFDQFFSNSSGDQYPETVAALTELGASSIAGLLQEAKQVLFGQSDVPRDRTKRYQLMATSSTERPGYTAVEAGLDRLDRQFCAMDDEVSALLSRIADAHSLYPQTGAQLNQP